MSGGHLRFPCLAERSALQGDSERKDKECQILPPLPCTSVLILYTQSMIIIGHRGACGYEPENTLVSFKKALAQQVDAIELDVHVVKTGELVVIHDSRVDRTTNGTGYVTDFDLASICELDAGEGQKIPLLNEVLDFVNKKVPVHIELKGENTAKPVSELIDKYKADHEWSDNDFLVSSFNHPELQTFKELSPSIRIGALIVGIPVGYGAFAAELGAYSANIFSEFVNKTFVDDMHSRGLKVLVFTVDDESEVHRMIKLGVDGIFTNYPDKARVFANS